MDYFVRICEPLTHLGYCINKSTMSRQKSPKGISSFLNSNKYERDPQSLSQIRPSSKPGNFIILSPPLQNDLSENSESNLGLIAFNEGVRRANLGQYEMAKYSYEVAAAYGELGAIHNLATMYLYGQGTPKNFTCAKEFFIKCAFAGLALSMSQLGYMYLYGRGVEKDYRTAREWFLRANDTEDEPYAQFCLCIIYMNGFGVAPNKKRAISWLIKSARNNFSPALYNLGVFIETGEHGFNTSLTSAIEYYELANKYESNYYSMNNLGTVLCKLEKNTTKAIELFHKSAASGLSQSMFNLGEAYMNGVGVSKNASKAAKCYYEATKLSSNSAAEYALAVIFYNGIPGKVKPNLPAAKHWLEKASSHGNMNARRSLVILKDRSR